MTRRVQVLFTLVVVILAIAGIVYLRAREPRLEAHTLLAIKDTMLRGGILAGVSARFSRENGRFARLGELEAQVKLFATDGNIFPERLSTMDGGGIGLIRPHFTGTGGWIYNETNGSIRLNINNPIQVEKSGQLYLRIGDLDFAKAIEIEFVNENGIPVLKQYEEEFKDLAERQREDVLSLPSVGKQ